MSECRGKVSTKKMVSNLTGNLHDIVKRRLMALSHYRFRMKLHSMSKKFGTTIFDITNKYYLLSHKNGLSIQTTLCKDDKSIIAVEDELNSILKIHKITEPGGKVLTFSSARLSNY
jgi:hypothetical protein